MSPPGAGRSFVRTLAPLDGAAPGIIINSITAARSLRGDLLSGKRHDEQVTGWRSPTKASRSTDGTRRPKLRFARDSPLEEDGFELVVPLSKRTPVPSSPFGFPVDGTGCERSNLRKRRFRVPGSQGNLARQGTCVVLNGWCIEACVGGVTGWAIGAGGDP